MPRGYFYIFGTEGNDSRGHITNIPGECRGTVFMGPCKPEIRSRAQHRDWIVGISNAEVKPRKILSMIEVEDKPPLWKAIDGYPEAIWNEQNPHGQIYFEARKVGRGFDYDYIKGAPHNESHRHNDLEKYPDTATLIVGSPNSILLEEQGYVIDRRILNMIRRDSTVRRRHPTTDCPLGRMLRRRDGKWVCQSYPRFAEVPLDESDIEYFEKIVDSLRGQRNGGAARKRPSDKTKVCRT